MFNFIGKVARTAVNTVESTLQSITDIPNTLKEGYDTGFETPKKKAPAKPRGKKNGKA